MIVHPIPPVFDTRSRVLILGSFPSVKSREEGFFYGHRQNRFWPLIATLTGEATPRTVEEKRALLLAHGIALWDVLAACDITGSADSTIKNAVPNDLSPILTAAPVACIITNGRTAHACYSKHIYPLTHREAICLPSTSPANAACSLSSLIDAWSAVLCPFLS